MGASWAPGPQFSALFQPFPEGGYMVELDVYLGPSYEAVGPAEGTYVFEFPTWKGAVVGYSVSFGTLSNGSFHYLWMPVWEGDGELLVDTHPVTEAGWYAFRFVFQDHDGELAVDFELADRTGQTLFTKSMTSTFYGGTPVSDFATSNVATGYAWFTSISPGLVLPIDEYQVRRGRCPRRSHVPGPRVETPSRRLSVAGDRSPRRRISVINARNSDLSTRPSVVIRIADGLPASSGAVPWRIAAGSLSIAPCPSILLRWREEEGSWPPPGSDPLPSTYP